MKSEHKLCIANETLSKLEDDLNNLKSALNNNKDEIVCFNNNLLKETSTKNLVDNNNKKLNEMINDRDIKNKKLF